MITINITQKEGALTVEVIDRESDPVSVTLYTKDVDGDLDIIKAAEAAIAAVRPIPK